MNNKFWIIAVFILFLSGCATVEGDWNSAKQENTIFSYKRFLQKHPESPFTGEAQSQLENREWDRAKENDTPKSYNDYLKKYPQGSYADEAKKRIEPAAFKQAQKAETISSLETFIKRYPSSTFVKDAELRIEELKKEVELEAEFYAKLSTLDNQIQVEKLIDSHSRYTFMKNVIPKVENMIITKIKTEGPEPNRFVAKVPVGTRATVRNTITSVESIEGTTKAAKKPAKKRKKTRTNNMDIEDTTKVAKILYGKDFPSDHDGLAALISAPDWGENSILRFDSEEIGINIKGYVYYGKGDRLHRLTFVLIKNIGFVYVRGTGQVVSPKGEIFNF
jgi:hypothetical protein